MRFAGYLVVGVLLVVLGAACGDASDSTPAPTERPEPTPTATPVPYLLPDTPIVAALTSIYKVQDGERSISPPGELPVVAGSVQARWYQSSGQYVVHYAGLSLAESGPLCPGNSILTDAGFLHLSNSPSGPGGCPNAKGLARAPAGVKLCGAEVLYLTEIPVDVEGTLYGTIERFLPDGTIIGLTSLAEADGTAAPEIDLSPCSSPGG